MCITILCVPLQYQNKQTMKREETKKQLEMQINNLEEIVRNCTGVEKTIFIKMLEDAKKDYKKGNYINI